MAGGIGRQVWLIRSDGSFLEIDDVPDTLAADD